MRKLTYEFVRSQIEAEGYQLISTEYKNANTKLNLRCPKNHIYDVTWGHFQSGKRCPYCAGKILTYDFIKEQIADAGYTLLSTEYKNCSTKLRIKCSQGHEYSARWNAFRDGHRCPYCAGNAKYTLDHIGRVVQDSNYKLISTEYDNCKDKLTFHCDHGHTYTASWEEFNRGQRCPKCSHRVSKDEAELYEIIKTYLPDTIQSDHSIIKPLELDIVIPSKKIAIEYCGLYWHSLKSNSYHLHKLQECNKQGYELITIFEDEWKENREIVLAALKHKLNISEACRVHARKCTIQEINVQTKNEFLNMFHIQGSDRATIKIGAFHEKRLVGVMTLLKNKSGWILSRFCTDIHYRIPGIASKMFKYFVRQYAPKMVVTYADRRWSTGKLYEALDFTLDHVTAPSYFYLLNNHRKHKFNFRRSILENKLKNYNSKLSEATNMKNNNISRIFDCGYSVWKWKI